MTMALVPIGVLGFIALGVAGWVLYWKQQSASPDAMKEATAANREAAAELRAVTDELKHLLENINTTLILSHLAEDNAPADLSEMDRRTRRLLEARLEEETLEGDG
jgi:hypothetical protein